MDKLTKIQMKLRDVGCPRCYHTEFHVTLHPGDTEESLTYQARCGNCGYHFEVNDHQLAWDDLEERTLSHIRREGCPRCKSHRLTLNFRCTLESRACFHIASCENCGASFVLEKYDEQDKPSLLDR